MEKKSHSQVFGLLSIKKSTIFDIAQRLRNEPYSFYFSKITRENFSTKN